MLHGSGNGVLTIARGAVPLAIFGPDNYGYRLGLIGAPARIAQAMAPLAFGLLIDRLGADTLWVSAGLSLTAFAVLCALRIERAPEASRPDVRAATTNHAHDADRAPDSNSP